MENRKQKEFFQKCLYEALIKLMKRKLFVDISVSELCEEAGVSRMTYYRSYSSKEDILKQHLEVCFERFMCELRDRTNMSFYEIAVTFFEFWENEEKEFLAALIDSGLSTNLMDLFYEYLDVIYESMELGETVESFVKSFLAGGLYKLLIDWIKSDSNTPIQEMAEFLAKGSKALVEK